MLYFRQGCKIGPLRSNKGARGILGFEAEFESALGIHSTDVEVFGCATLVAWVVHPCLVVVYVTMIRRVRPIVRWAVFVAEELL